MPVPSQAMLEAFSDQALLRALKKVGHVSIVNGETQKDPDTGLRDTTFVMACDFKIGKFKSRLQLEAPDIRTGTITLLQFLMSLNDCWIDIARAVAEADEDMTVIQEFAALE